MTPAERKQLERIVEFPPVGYPGRSDDGYPSEPVYDEYAFRRIVETYRNAIRHVLDGQIYLSPEMTNHLLHRLGSRRHDLLDGPSLELLSDREWEVFELIGRGRATRQIAEQLHLSIKTIETHREHIKQKLHLSNSAELAQRAVQWVLEDS